MLWFCVLFCVRFPVLLFIGHALPDLLAAQRRQLLAVLQDIHRLDLADGLVAAVLAADKAISAASTAPINLFPISDLQESLQGNRTSHGSDCHSTKYHNNTDIIQERLLRNKREECQSTINLADQG